MERQRSQAVEALEISDGFVNCQSCCIAVPIVGKLGHVHNNDRIAVLQNRIKWLEGHYHNHRLGSIDTKRDPPISLLLLHWLKCLRYELSRKTSTRTAAA